ncbi:hypothetical protein LX32DRAFT_258354 [Colletotrichum zoysiae]|uniref:Uncharacterized protein n=1 Tax=Colletotrichum zoysiae TaxID=1216348 RepID=A0AAD9H2W6_9PEZI|nr:hypothetical protein LX32DRAFT_258354 [Colletotrichum zoysiae]
MKTDICSRDAGIFKDKERQSWLGFLFCFLFFLVVMVIPSGSTFCRCFLTQSFLQRARVPMLQQKNYRSTTGPCTTRAAYLRMPGAKDRLG